MGDIFRRHCIPYRSPLKGFAEYRQDTEERQKNGNQNFAFSRLGGRLVERGTKPPALPTDTDLGETRCAKIRYYLLTSAHPPFSNAPQWCFEAVW